MFNEIKELSASLDEMAHNMAKYGKEAAEANRHYRQRVKEEVLKERDKGTPTTIITAIVKGTCSNEEFDRDCAEVFYKVAFEKIQIIKKQMEMINDEIRREWGQK